MPSEMIERVARAICTAEGQEPDLRAVLNDGKVDEEPIPSNANWENYVADARAAIEAMREITNAMHEVALRCWDEAKCEQEVDPVFLAAALNDVYRATIDEALKDEA